MIKMIFQRTAQILQKRYLASYVSIAWERCLPYLFIKKKNAANQSTSVAALLLIKDTRVFKQSRGALLRLTIQALFLLE